LEIDAAAVEARRRDATSGAAGRRRVAAIATEQEETGRGVTGIGTDTALTAAIGAAATNAMNVTETMNAIITTILIMTTRPRLPPATRGKILPPSPPPSPPLSRRYLPPRPRSRLFPVQDLHQSTRGSCRISMKMRET
jgi:hypothetical protein